jgi:hypothetical protein
MSPAPQRYSARPPQLLQPLQGRRLRIAPTRLSSARRSGRTFRSTVSLRELSKKLNESGRDRLRKVIVLGTEILPDGHLKFTQSAVAPHRSLAMRRRFDRAPRGRSREGGNRNHQSTNHIIQVVCRTDPAFSPVKQRRLDDGHLGSIGLEPDTLSIVVLFGHGVWFPAGTPTRECIRLETAKRSRSQSRNLHDLANGGGETAPTLGQPRPPCRSYRRILVTEGGQAAAA